uniref:Uncharacterized protein n=1 Tax=Trichuris muris TaxID=70415 RepID=A0A5S6Q3S8_TRIMR
MGLHRSTVIPKAIQLPSEEEAASEVAGKQTLVEKSRLLQHILHLTCHANHCNASMKMT